MGFALVTTRMDAEFEIDFEFLWKLGTAVQAQWARYSSLPSLDDFIRQRMEDIHVELLHKDDYKDKDDVFEIMYQLYGHHGMLGDYEVSFQEHSLANCLDESEYLLDDLSKYRVTKRCATIKEELIAKVFHPDRVDRLGGYDWLDALD